MLPTARRMGTPMATRTCEGSHVEFEQALPELTAIPRSSRAATSASLSMPVKAMLRLFGRQLTWQPFTSASGMRAQMPSRSRSRSARTRADRSWMPAAASDSAVAVPAMPATFSVPARFCISWPPPTSSGWNGVARRRYRMPLPFGPPNLCDDRLSASTPSRFTSSGIHPGACTASVWSSTRCPFERPYSRRSPASSATGCNVPTSLLASITLATTVVGRSAASNSSTCTRPEWSQPSHVTSKPRSSRCWAACSPAWCSMEVVMTWFPAPARRIA